jgi:hypothetical protein
VVARIRGPLAAELRARTPNINLTAVATARNMIWLAARSSRLIRNSK